MFIDTESLFRTEPIYGRQKNFAPSGAWERQFSIGSMNISPLRGEAVCLRYLHQRLLVLLFCLAWRIPALVEAGPCVPLALRLMLGLEPATSDAF